MSNSTIIRTVTNRETRTLRVPMEHEILPVKDDIIGWGSKAKRRPGMPARVTEIRFFQDITNGVTRGVSARLFVERLKKDGGVSKTGETNWVLSKRSEDWQLKRTFDSDTIDRIFTLLNTARKEWEAIDWEKVEA